MAGSKTDPRVENTRNALHHAFFVLVQTKPISNITVTDLCAHADINRSTFYLHYRDVLQLIDDIETHLLEQMGEQLKHVHSIDQAAELLIQLKHAPETQNLFRALLAPSGDPRFLQRLNDLSLELFKHWWQGRFPAIQADRARLLFQYNVYGIVALIASWMQDESQSLSAQDVVSMINDLMFSTLACISDREGT